MAVVSLLSDSLSKFTLLPVEIRNPKNGSLAGRTVIRSLDSELAALGEGQWDVIIALPSGRHFGTTVNVNSSGEADTGDIANRLEASADKVAAASAPSVARIGNNIAGQSWLTRLPGNVKSIDWKGLAGNVAVLAVNATGFRYALETAPAIGPRLRYGSTRSLRHPTAKLTFFRGPVFSGGLSEIAVTDLKIEMSEGAMTISDPGQKPLVITLLRPDLPPTNVILPPATTLHLSLQKHDSSEAVVVAVGFNDAFTDQAVSFRARNSLYELTTMAENLTLEEIGNLGAKPAGAAVCLSYLILNTRNSETVRFAIDGLSEEAKNSPDAALIIAEASARDGNPLSAMPQFLDASRRGLPWFGAGLGLLVDRLALYQKMMSVQKASPEFAGELKTAIDKLAPFAANTDYSAPVTTYTGSNPIKPGSASTARAEFLSAPGFPISLS